MSKTLQENNGRNLQIEGAASQYDESRQWENAHFDTYSSDELTTLKKEMKSRRQRHVYRRSLVEQMKSLLHQSIRNRIVKKASFVMAGLVVFATTYSLILPALTLDYDSLSDLPGLHLGQKPVVVEVLNSESSTTQDGRDFLSSGSSSVSTDAASTDGLDVESSDRDRVNQAVEVTDTVIPEAVTPSDTDQSVTGSADVNEAVQADDAQDTHKELLWVDRDADQAEIDQAVDDTFGDQAVKPALNDQEKQVKEASAKDNETVKNSDQEDRETVEDSQPEDQIPLKASVDNSESDTSVEIIKDAEGAKDSTEIVKSTEKERADEREPETFNSSGISEESNAESDVTADNNKENGQSVSADEMTAGKTTVVDETTDEAVTEEQPDERIVDEDTEVYEPIDQTFTRPGEYSIHVTAGADAQIPQDAILTVSEIPYNSLQYYTLASITKDTLSDNSASVVYNRFFDISFVVDGQTMEPKAAVNVEISFDKAQEFSEEQKLSVVHFAENQEKISEVLENESKVTENGMIEGVSFETGSFSVFGVVYTVDFYGEDGYEFSIPGGGYVALSEVVKAVGLAEKYQAKSVDEGGEVQPSEEDTLDQSISSSSSNNDEENSPDSQEDTDIDETVVDENEKKVDIDHSNSGQGENASALDDSSIRDFIENVESVTFSDPSMVWVENITETTTVGALKETNGLEVQYSDDLTEEEIAEINSSTVEAGDWALISVRPFTSEESLTITIKNGEQFVVKVTDGQISTHVITADGEDYIITVTFDDGAEIPKDSKLHVKEILAGTEEYKDYSKQAYSFFDTSETEKKSKTANLDNSRDSEVTIVSLPEETNESGFARFFDISIISNGKEIEPKVPVNVKIEYVDPIELTSDEELQIVHFAEKGIEIITPEVKGNEISFEQDSFSVTATIATNPSVGNSYALLTLYEGTYYEVMFDGTLQEVTPVPDTTNKFTVSMAEQWWWGPESYYDWLSDKYGLRVLKNNGTEYIDPTALGGTSSTFRTLTRTATGNGYLLSSGNTYLGISTDPTTGALFLSGTNSKNDAETFFFASLARTTTGRTVDHIDIGVEAKANVEVPLAYGTYYYADGTVAETVGLGEYKNASGTNNEIPITEEDLMSATISSYTLNNGNRVADNSFIINEYTSSTQVGEIDQVRIGGTFPVGWVTLNGNGERGKIEQYITNQNQVYYEVALTKPVNLTLQKNRNGTMADLYQKDANGNLVKLEVSVNVALTSSFSFWDDDNECPGLRYINGYSQQGTGPNANSSLYPAGMDFRLGTTNDTDSSVAAIEIIKYTVNTDGQLISVDSGGTFNFDIYQDVDGDVRTPSEWSGETNASIDYSSYSKVSSRSITTGSSGYGVAYDYSVDQGLVYIQETGNLENSTIIDTDGNTWDYVDTYILTEYAWRHPSDNGPPRNNPKIHSNVNQNDKMRAIPDVVGDYYSEEYEGELHNTFLEFYVYNVYKGGEVKFKKVDQSGYMIEGATFELYLSDPSIDSDAITAYRATSARNEDTGIVEVDFGSVAYGTYYMKETGAPEGYVKDTNVYRVEVYEGEAGTEVCKIERKTANGWVELSKDDNLYVFPNTPKYVNDFNITKVDENGSQVNGATLKFEKLVTTKTGDQYVDYDFDTSTSGNQSTITIGTQDISLGTGKYRISEATVPTGYEGTFDYIYLTVNGEDATITLTDPSGNAITGVTDPEHSNKTTYTITNDDGLAIISMEETTTTVEETDGTTVTSHRYKLQVVNKSTSRNLKIRKVDTSTTPVPLKDARFTMAIDGVTYVLTSNEEGYLEFSGKIVDETEVALTEDDPSGILTSLQTGSYVLMETDSPAGYIMLEEGVRISVGTTVTAIGGTVKAYDKNNNEIEEGDTDTEVSYYVICVANEPGTPLPATGGPGTLLMYGLGAVVAEITGYNILSKRRKKYLKGQKHKIMKKRWS